MNVLSHIVETFADLNRLRIGSWDRNTELYLIDNLL